MGELLDKIEKPNDIKEMEKDELRPLAKEIRQFLVHKISHTGGHLASNLGVVELTMALHLCCNLPEDKIVWDVGHQSYTHKILTGRKDGFEHLRQFGGMSGFPKQSESDCDAFDTGHSEMLDMSSYKDLLSDNNFDTVDFNLLTEEIPEDAQIIVLGVPSTDLTSEEVEKLNTYLNDTSSSVDRSVLIVSYPGQGELPTLNSYLGEWGMSVTPSEVLEGDSKSYIQSPDMIIATVSDELDLDSESSYGYIVSPQTNPVEILWEGRNSVSTYPLLTTSSSAYLYDITTGEEQTDTAGTYNLAAAGVKMIKGEDGSYFNANVIVVGSAYLFNSMFTSSSTYSNGQYIADLSRYATGTTGSSTAIYSTPTQTITYDITMSGAQIIFLGLVVFAVLIPLAFLITGIVVFFRRRHL